MDNLVPLLKDASVTVSLVPTGETDLKYALELGLSIMMDKPIIAVVTPGAKVPSRLLRVADAIVEGDLGHPETLRDRITAAIERLDDEDEVLT